MGMVGGAALGPGSPQPVAYGYRTPSIGKPSIDFEPKSNQLRTTVGQGRGDSKLSADYSFRPPVHPVGGGGIGETGAFVGARA